MPLVLIVEDEAAWVRTVERNLKKKGFQIIVATFGQDAIKIARSELPDIILMDKDIPSTNTEGSALREEGYRTARQLKSDPDTQSIPIIALTGSSGTDQPELAKSYGCDDYLCKHDDDYKEQLVNKIESLLSKTK